MTGGADQRYIATGGPKWCPIGLLPSRSCPPLSGIVSEKPTTPPTEHNRAVVIGGNQAGEFLPAPQSTVHNMPTGNDSQSTGGRSDEPHWHTLSVDQVVDAHDIDLECGLDEDEARRRLETYGPNEVESTEQTPWWRILLDQFLDPLIYILMVAAVVALVFGEYIDAGVIAAVLVINGGIGFFQEIRARSAIESLAAMAAPKARVLRDGAERTIPSREIVPGDIVSLTSGTRVPADLRLLRSRDLSIDESALTGESMAIAKETGVVDDEHAVPGDQINMAFSSTVVTRGRGRGLVVRTGDDTELGQIASAMRGVADTKAPIQHKVRTLSHWIGGAIAFFTAIVFAVGWLQQRALDEIVGMAIAMAVAAIPEALPIVLTVTLAVGVRRMAEQNAITRSLPAVETLGSTTVIGSDKTGTLTMNQMTVKAIWSASGDYEVSKSGYDIDGTITLDGDPVDVDDDPPLKMTLLAGILANEASAIPTDDDDDGEEDGGDPTELALLVSAQKAGFDIDDTRRSWTELDVIPFESERQYMASLREDDDGDRFIFVKGAPEAVIPRCNRRQVGDETEPIDEGEILDEARRLAHDGYRVLATAFVPSDNDDLDEDDVCDELIFAGFQAMEDPLRPEAREAVEQSQRAGIRVLMLTGDHADTAQAIGRQLGLGNGDEPRVVEGTELEQMSDTDVDEVMRDVDVFARVAPEHKLRIVERLRAADEIVAVTGDGVNDAPALRAADLGIAMGKAGTDVAREASDMVLSDDNFATIKAAIEEGRVVFNNIRKVTYFLLSTGVGLVLAILLALFFGWPLPFVAVQVLWINLITKGLQDVSLAFEPGEPGQLDMPPRPSGEGIFHRPVLIRMLTVGAFLGVVTLGVFWWFYRSTGDLVLAQTIAMTQMVVFQFFHVGNCRSLHRSIFSISLFSNKALLFAVIGALIAHIAIIYVPPMQFLFQTTEMGLAHWLWVFGISLSIIAVVEIDKWWLRRRGYGPGLDVPR